MNDPTRPASGPLEISEKLWDRFERTGDSAQLDEVIELLRDAAGKTDADPYRQASVLSNLGAALLRKFDRSGSAGELDEAIAVLRELPQPECRRLDVRVLCRISGRPCSGNGE